MTARIEGARCGPAPRLYSHSDGRSLSLAAWACEPDVAALGISHSTLRDRVRVGGWPGDSMFTTPPARGIGRKMLLVSGAPKAAVDSTTRYEDDDVCRALVAANPDGMNLAEIGEALGFTRERARQIEAIALHKVAAVCALSGIRQEDFVAALMSRRSSAFACAPESAEAYEMPTRGRSGGLGGLHEITDGPLVELEALLADVERRAEFVANVTRIARRHA